MEKSRTLQPALVGATLVGLVALLLYGLFLSLDFADVLGGGESRMSNAFAAVGALGALWIALLILLAIDLGCARRPTWAKVATVLLVLIAGPAILFATDYPGNGLCALSVIALPPVIGAHFAIGMIPRLRATAEGQATNAIMLLLIGVLSVYPIVKFIS